MPECLLKEFTGFSIGVAHIISIPVMTCPFFSVIYNFVLMMAPRFGHRGWDKFPLTADTYADWIRGANGDLVNVFIDYETFGEHFWKE